jgi:hypothetical protein
LELFRTIGELSHKPADGQGLLRMVSRSRFSAFSLALGTVLLTQACAQPPARGTTGAAGPQCQSRIIVSFAAVADTATVAAVATAAGVRLTVVSRLMPDTYVLDLLADGQDAACNVGLERIRHDARVRAAEPDRRRGPHAG